MYHIEEDIRDSAQLIISTFGGLSSLKNKKRTLTIGTDVHSRQQSYTEGSGTSARFHKITGFLQLKGTPKIIAVDSGNHCLRKLSTLNNEFFSETFAGRCMQSGSDDGHLHTSRFFEPYNIIEGFFEDEYYVTDTRNHAIRLIILKNSSVVTIKTLANWEQPRGIALDRTTKTLLVTVGLSNKVEILKMDISGNNVNRLKVREFVRSYVISFRVIKNILFLNPETYIIADWGGGKLWRLKLSGNSTEAIAKEMSNVSYPLSMALSERKDKLYVGERGSIQAFSVTGM